MGKPAAIRPQIYNNILKPNTLNKIFMKSNKLIEHLNGIETEVKRFINDLAPVIAGKVAVDAFSENFYNEVFFDEPWQEVQRRIPGTAANRYATDAGRTRSVLTGTGDLGRSIEVQRADNSEAVMWSNPNVFTSRDSYGAVHNEGLHAGRGSGFTMPKHQVYRRPSYTARAHNHGTKPKT